ncbi:hypothetical protein D0864_04418 [Hortaea werneckii]|uniref:Zn(2)-C6 fungal-type domain-containing protein n=1 Tax=Hortaea werneckii TaxID=91943 RepID=A0A3M7GBA2_HORWE|nr:hypothetical protein KC317_g9773 [Hortaea werneckii]RMY98353.1 hypothetical protein D0864_04418 [Hortaea werneckii]
MLERDTSYDECRQVEDSTARAGLGVRDCDEKKPTCSNCVRQGAECVYSNASPTASATDKPESPYQPLNGEGVQNQYDGFDLLLMNHFSSTTALELFPNDGARHVWQRVLPREAIRSPLLMHGILALSGLDMACSDATSPTASQARTRALHHQQRGLALFQASLQDPAKADIHATFAFSIMLVILAFASAQSEPTFPSVDGILEHFGLFRGNRTLAQMNWEAIRASHILALIDPGAEQQEYKLDPKLASYLEEFKDAQPDDTLKDAVTLLTESVHVSSGRFFDSKAIGRWPSMMEEAFMDRLKAHQPEALVILAHYAIVMQAYRRRRWVGNWADILVEAVDQALSASDKARLSWSVDGMRRLMEMNVREH